MKPAISNRLLILGASARQAAQSAARSGLRVIAGDLFGDSDLACCADARRVAEFPGELLEVAASVARCSWIYTGGLENHPDLVERISAFHTLWGNGSEILRLVRDPFRLASVIREAGLHSPPLIPNRPGNDAAKWLRKPVRGCGGRQITFAPERESAAMKVRSQNRAIERDQEGGETEFYYQQFIGGPTYGVLFLAANGKSQCIGVTRQLVGSKWAGAQPFQYVGSIGPIATGPSVTAQLHDLGDVLAARFALQGLFGVDVAVARGIVWVLEVNPRFTASVEIHERARGWCAIRSHRDACLRQSLVPTLETPKRLHGKAVVYAPRGGTVDECFHQSLARENSDGSAPRCADLPQTGTRVAKRAPLVTVFAEGDHLRDTMVQLRRQARQVLQRWATVGASGDSGGAIRLQKH